MVVVVRGGGSLLLILILIMRLRLRPLLFAAHLVGAAVVDGKGLLGIEPPHGNRIVDDVRSGLGLIDP